MICDNSDASWERIGSENPYFGVLTDPRFRGRALEGDVKATFLQTGEDHVEWLTAAIARYFGGLARKEAALDFGCGVGRVVVPLAARFKQVVGVDISDSMLAAESRRCSCNPILCLSSGQQDSSVVLESARIIPPSSLEHERLAGTALE